MTSSTDRPAFTPDPADARADLALDLRQLWQTGREPDARQILRDAGAVSLSVLLEVLGVDQCERWERGRQLPAEEYFRWFPELTGDPEGALELVYGEYVLREQLGQHPDPAEYVRRFPQYAERLQRQLALHGALAAAESEAPDARDRIVETPAAGHDTPSAGPPTPGGRPVAPAVAGYEVMGELGRGGMGVVYKAWQERPRRLVALKMILAGGHAGPERRARLLAEADAIARLHHPHIVQIHEAGEHAGLPFLVLEYMSGGNLAARLGGQPQPPIAAARLTETLASAVAHAHAAGVIHRDLKPANVLLTADGKPKISDFGLAKLGDVDLTATGVILGTPSYIAPEQAAGSRAVGPGADVYALGAILYELLTGRPPFRAATALETLEQVRTREPVPVWQLQPRVPPDLATVCLKCLEKDPARRYPTARELADDLRRFLEDRPVRARRASALERGRRWVRRNPWPAAAGLLLLVLVAGVTVAAWRFSSDARKFEKAERKATDQLYEALQARAEASRSSGLPGQRIESLKALQQAAVIARERGLPASELLQLRNQAVACLALPDLALDQEWEGNPPGTCGLELDAHFERYAWCFEDEGVRIRSLADHRELFRIRTLPASRQSRMLKCRFSPDGRFLAVYYRQWCDQHPVEVWDLQHVSGSPVATLPDAATRPEFTADGRTLVAALPDGALTLIDLPSGAARSLPPGWPAEKVALQPGGRAVAVASSKPAGVQVRDLATGAVLREFRLPDAVGGVAWAPHGDVLAVGCNDLKIYLWDSSTGEIQGTLAGHQWDVDDLCFDETGRWLASFGWDMTLRLWDVGARRQLIHLNDVRVLSFRQDGGLSAAGIVGQRAKVWSFRPSAVYNQLYGTTRRTYAPHFSPDGRWLAACGSRDEMCLWDVAAHRLAGRWPELGQAVWGPDGTWLLAGGPGGFVRLPVSKAGNKRGDSGVVRIGPGRRLPGVEEDTRPWVLMWLDPAGRHLGVKPSTDTTPTVRVLDVGEDSVRDLWKVSHRGCNFLMSSPDGRLVAVACLDGGEGTRIWDGATGRLVRDLGTGDVLPVFGIDGKTLFTTTGRLNPRGAECRSWRLDTYEPTKSLMLNQCSSSPAPMAVGSDGILAISYTINDPRLVEADTFEEIVTLSAPDSRIMPYMRFSPDASQLAVTFAGAIGLWDLRRLREELTLLGLDWDRPPYPPPGAVTGPLTIEKVPDRSTASEER